MLFNSYDFLFFLPIVWMIYFGLNRFHLYRSAQIMLIVASFFFYGYADYRLAFLLAFSILINFCLHIGLTAQKKKKKLDILFLIAGMSINIGLLFYFKYVDFMIDNLNRIFGAGIAFQKIVLPLGISFYTFQQLSFVIDSYKGNAPRYRFADYCLFVCFFPQLIAGPIVLHKEIIPQFHSMEKRRVNFENMMCGAEYFILGFAKKILVADTFSRICDAGYENLHVLNAPSAILTMLAFTFQIYFDFSGYCDMAMGLGKFFNIDLPVNFDSPYKAATIADFWKRWHMTLTRFLTTYIYIPLGGSRKGKVRTHMNILIVFMVSGIWHGAAWTYVLWGILHGVAMVIYRLGRNMFDRFPKWIMRVGTFLFVNIAWIFFRAEYFRQPFILIARFFKGGFGKIDSNMLSGLCDDTALFTLLSYLIEPGRVVSIKYVAFYLWFLIWTVVCLKTSSSHERVIARHRNIVWYLWLSIVFVWSFTWLSQVSKFIYFNF